MKRSFKISILITALAIPLATLHGVTLEYYMHKGKPLHGERIFQPVRGALVPSEVVALASFDQKNPFYSNETVVVRDGNTFRFGAILVGIGAYQSFYPVYISGLLPRQYPAHEIGKLSGNIFTRPVTPPQKTKEPTEPAPSKPTEPEEKKPETTEPTKPAPSKPIEPGEKKPETTEPTEPAPSKPTEPGEKKPEKAKGGDAWESEQEIPAETGKTINTVEILKEFITKTAKEQLMDASEAFISDIIRALGGQLTTEEALQMGYLPISETTIQKRIKQEVETELVRRDALRKAKEEKQADQKQDLFVEIPTSSDKKPAFFTLATLELFKKNQRAEREKTGKNVFISASTYRPVIEREDILLLDEGSYRDVLASWLYWKNKGRDLKEFLDDLAYGDAVSMNTLLADHDTVKNLLKTIGIEEATIQTFLKQNTDPISLEAVADFIRETKPKPETPAEPAIETKGPRAIGNSATPDDIAGAMYDGDNKFWPGEVVVIVRPNGTSWEYGEIIAEQNPGMYNVAFGPLKKLSGSIPAQSIGKLGPLYDNQKVLERASKSMSTQDYYNKLKSDEIITGLPAEFSGNNYDQITEVLGDDGKNLLHETSSSRHDRVTDYLAFEDGEEEIKNIPKL